MLAGAKFVLHLRAQTQSRIEISSKFADAIVAISEYTREQYPPKIGQRARVVNNPVRPPCATEERRSCRDRVAAVGGAEMKGTLIVGYVANFMDQKRPLVFVEIAAQLRERLGDRVFCPMIGETDGVRDREIGKQAVTRITEYGLSSQCVLLGPRYPIEPWIMGFDVLVAPAVREGFGRTLVEGMLCGTPVVAADDGGHREIIRHGETGLLAKADDPSAFARAVMELHENPRMASAMAAAAKADALTKYSVEAHVERIQAIYDSLLP